MAKWKNGHAPWYTGFHWPVLSAGFGLVGWRIFGELHWLVWIVIGFGVGCINWAWSWSEWSEFGPDWDGGM